LVETRLAKPADTIPFDLASDSCDYQEQDGFEELDCGLRFAPCVYVPVAIGLAHRHNGRGRGGRRRARVRLVRRLRAEIWHYGI